MVLQNQLLRGFIILTLQELLLAGWLVGKLVSKSLSQSFKSFCENVKLIAVILNAVVCVVVVVARGRVLTRFIYHHFTCTDDRECRHIYPKPKSI